MTRLLQDLDQAGAVLLNRHFVYTSGKHGSAYINLDPVLPDIEMMTRICQELVKPFAGQVDTIAAPATGGIVLAVLSARILSSPSAPVAAVWADREEGALVFMRAGFLGHLTRMRVLVVDDLLTTGGSVSRVCRAAVGCGAKLVGVSVICNRGDLTARHLDVPRLDAVLEVSLEATGVADCDLCRRRIPIVEDIGHGAKFKARYPDYPGGYVGLDTPNSAIGRST
jgi:orotate phosphoribosyltransferase